MTTKSIESPLPLPLGINKPIVSVGETNKDFIFDKVLFDVEALSILQSVFSPVSQNNFDAESFTKSAGVKFMITMQDESDLRALGYSKEKIDQLKPQEAAEIIQAGANIDSTQIKA